MQDQMGLKHELVNLTRPRHDILELLWQQEMPTVNHGGSSLNNVRGRFFACPFW